MLFFFCKDLMDSVNTRCCPFNWSILILKLSNESIDKHGTGVFIQRMTSDAEELSYIFTIGFGRCVGIISSLGTFISVFIINKIAFCYYAIVTIILTIIHLLGTKHVKNTESEKMNVCFFF